jgi:methyl-accepting chemotaxis protein
MSIKMHLIAFSLLSVLFSLIIGASGFWGGREMTGALQKNRTAAASLRNHMEADMMHDALRADVLAAALAGNLKQANQRKTVEQDLTEHLKLFRDALKENEALALTPEISQSIRKIRPLVDAYLADSQAVVALAFDSPGDIEARLPKFMQAFGILEKEMAALSDLIEKNVGETVTSARADSTRSENLSIAILLTSILCLGVLSVLTIRSVLANVRRVLDAVDRVSEGDLTYRVPALNGEFSGLGHSLNRFIANLGKIVADVSASSCAISTTSRQIAASNHDLSSRTESQAGSLEETASSIKELTGTVKQNADNARQANSLAASASEVASKGGAVVSQVVQTMGSINESAKKIVDIISVIDGIAFQTNILALNAAVEAARAGEQGRGFAVVAAEVRSLAQRSAGAAKEIKALISDSVEKVDAGAKLVDQAGATMNEVVASVKQVTDIIGEITAASVEQTAGIGQINQAIAALDDVTQQNAALVEEAASAAESLLCQADNLVKVVGVFKIDQAGAAKLTPAVGRAPKDTAAGPLAIPGTSGSAKRPTQHVRPFQRVANAPAGEWEQF